MPHLVLASASPRRAALLRELGVEFTIRISDEPEVLRQGEAADAFARRVARRKGEVVAAAHADAWVLSADTIVVLDGAVLGKPVNAADAWRTLQRLSGRIHEVLTAVALRAPDGGPTAEVLVRSTVEFRRLDDAELDAYIASGEPFDKAGAYGIQGSARAFVIGVNGSFSNVVGLPLDEVGALLNRAGLLPAAARRPSA